MNLNQLKITLLIAITIIAASIRPIKAQTEPNEPVVPAQEWRLWRTPRLIQTLREHDGTVSAVTFTPDGDIVISGGGHNDPTLKFWSVETGKIIQRVRAQRTGVLNLGVSPDGTTLVSTGEDREINIWNLQTGAHLSTFFEHSTSVLTMAISPDSRVMVTGGLDGIRAWNLTPQRPAFILQNVGNPTYTVAIHPNGYILASGHDDGKVKFWNLRTASEIAEFSSHSQQVSAVLFTLDGEKLITGSLDGTIKVWHLGTRQLLYTFTGHNSRIRALTLNPDGKVLASAANDGVRLWNIETGEFITVLTGHTDWVRSIAFSNDGKRLASGSFDTLIRVWEIPELEISVPTTTE
ncbi:WD40 repeat domain-containing protein [Gloeocapsa sp. PCC 73106]|uniref:WD40 repeat domain-containing protein n=1 Tax=Gloeocapsa sp. PCC 73106 TaxID=102232 RepID=UPI0002AC1582|nr:WD40 repeat domain-containing protein [Gloeocapsa sp. PCC 73106]ELR96768.1 WD40 repeat-containing protein [Gloeocapsa sp. PCC 73106]